MEKHVEDLEVVKAKTSTKDQMIISMKADAELVAKYGLTLKDIMKEAEEMGYKILVH